MDQNNPKTDLWEPKKTKYLEGLHHWVWVYLGAGISRHSWTQGQDNITVSVFVLLWLSLTNTETNPNRNLMMRQAGLSTRGPICCFTSGTRWWCPWKKIKDGFKKKWKIQPNKLYLVLCIVNWSENFSGDACSRCVSSNRLLIWISFHTRNRGAMHQLCGPTQCAF